MSIKDYIDIQYIWGLMLVFSSPLLVGLIFFINRRATKPLKKTLLIFIPTASLWLSFFLYDNFLMLKVESEVREYASNPYEEYIIIKDGKIQSSEALIYALRSVSTKFTNKTFSSRINERTYKIIRGSHSLTLRVFDSSSRESFYWVVYTVPGTNYEYIGRIQPNETY